MYCPAAWTTYSFEILWETVSLCMCFFCDVWYNVTYRQSCSCWDQRAYTLLSRYECESAYTKKHARFLNETLSGEQDSVSGNTSGEKKKKKELRNGQR